MYNLTETRECNVSFSALVFFYQTSDCCTAVDRSISNFARIQNYLILSISRNDAHRSEISSTMKLKQILIVRGKAVRKTNNHGSNENKGAPSLLRGFCTLRVFCINSGKSDKKYGIHGKQVIGHKPADL